MFRRPPRSPFFPYSTLFRSGPRSRARIAEETGLNKATVSSLVAELAERGLVTAGDVHRGDRKSTRLNSSHANISYAVFCLKKTNKDYARRRSALSLLPR